MFGLSLSRARLIASLLCSAGWLDDADEVLFEIIKDKDSGGPEVALEQALEVDSLINAINLVLPEDEQLRPTTMATYYNVVNS